ncbi:MAG TPA: hypothetical protein DCY91_23790 [Cyanobacteria bacterium UBA11370]|nr:hypothetical protein [Cyanobacteria bacterium UBA11370]
MVEMDNILSKKYIIKKEVALEKLEPKRILYLAIPIEIYQEFFTHSLKGDY